MTVDVKARLVLEDQASAALKKITGGLKETEEETKKADTQMGFFKQTLSTIVGMNFMGAVHQVVAFGESFVEVASQEASFLKQTAAMQMVIDDVSFGRAREEAEAFAGYLDNVGFRTGVAIDDIKSAFSTLNEITGAGAAGMRENEQTIGQMAEISRVLGKDVGLITQQFALMAEGMVRPRSQMFQLLQSVGVFNQNSRAAAAEWAKLTEEDRIRLLKDGVAKLADKFATVPAGFGQYLKALKNVIEVTKEEIGGPILKALGPLMGTLRKTMFELKPMLVELGEGVAEHVSDIIKVGTEWLKETVAYLVHHRKEIAEAIEAGIKKAREFVDFLLAHKAAIASMFVIHAAAPAAAGVASAAGAAGSALVGISGAGSTAAFVGGVTGLATALPIAVAATYAWSVAIDQYSKKSDESSAHLRADVNARKEYLQNLITTGGGFKRLTAQQREFNAEIARLFEKQAGLLGMSSKAAREFTDRALQQVDATQALVPAMEAAEEYFANLQQTMSALSAAEGAGPMALPEDVIADLSAAFMTAAQTQHVGAQQQIAAMLAGSRDMQQAFLESGKLTQEGYAALAELLPESAADFKKELERKAAEARGEGTGERAKSGTVNNFNGGQTFKINQEFRNADPDRIAMIFRRDILAAAERRIRAGTSSAFG